MSSTSYLTFTETIKGLEKAFSVKQIATFDLATANIDDDLASFLPKYRDYDQFPVQKNGRVIGVLERSDNLIDGSVLDCMQPLDDSIIISAEEPLERFIPLMENKPYYRLVLRRSSIEGIVTRSDLLKLPVRLLAFARVTYLEMIMSEIILAKCPSDDAWLRYLITDRQKNIKKDQRRHKKEHSDPPLLEFSGFLDKRDIVQQLLNLDQIFSEDMNDVVEIRNKVAHAGNFAADGIELTAFLLSLRTADNWIHKLDQQLRIIS